MIRYAALVLAVLAGGAVAQAGAGAFDRPVLAERAARRFPQPVRVGDLIGRQLLDHTEAQHVLGRVAAVWRRADGGLDLVIRRGGVLGVGASEVAVPADALALLGEYVVAVDVTPAQLDALPEAAGSDETKLGPEERIRMGLVRPAH